MSVNVSGHRFILFNNSDVCVSWFYVFGVVMFRWSDRISFNCILLYFNVLSRNCKKGRFLGFCICVGKSNSQNMGHLGCN